MGVIHWSHLNVSKRTLWLTAGVVLGAALALGSFTLGYDAGRERPKHLIVRGIANVEDPDAAADFGLFWEVRDTLKREHIRGASFDDQESVYGAISGMVGTLDDPNTAFLKPVVSKKFEEDIRGEFGGIGAEIAKRDGRIVVVAPLPDSPAERAGIRAKDTILKVDERALDGVEVEEAVTYIRGEVGTTVTLTIFHDGGSETEEIPVVRDVIRVPTAKLTMREGGIAHIELLSFNEHAGAAFFESVVKASELGTTNGLILDLRNNPGGFLEVAVDIAGWFLDRGALVVSEEFRSGEKHEFAAHGNGALKDVPVVVLVNGGSASASEIVAGALRDHRRVPLVGETTFGKGTVQELRELSDGKSKLKLTIAHWRLPGGDIIEESGIAPTVEVKFTREDAEAGRDPQLDRAIQLLKEEMSNIAQH